MVFLSSSLATLLILAGAANARLRFPCSQLVTQRVDPIVSPGNASAHVHQIVGGDLNVHYLSVQGRLFELLDGHLVLQAQKRDLPQGSSIRKHRYWKSQRWHDNILLPTPSTHKKPYGNRVPEGVVPTTRSPYLTEHKQPPSDACKELGSVLGLPVLGWRQFSIVPLTRLTSHTLLAIQRGQGLKIFGTDCPPTHPVSTGYGHHADFLFGWEGDSLQRAMDCAGQGGISKNCPGLTIQTDEEMNKCSLDPIVDEVTEGTYLEKLPGCKPNPWWT
ncbi:hypothetical protein BKA70DRAFT_1468219, partial [Coprinopsis sp. MPI-PUGE-AT-0042]